MSGPFSVKNATIGAILGMIVYLLILLALRLLLGSVPLNVAAILTILAMLAYPGALVLGAILSLRRQRRARAHADHPQP
ncbi:MAG TPA: hypothetical protein VIL85_09855 [Thermomicrobiales bacterium]|jgi:uncharacterized membrane protein